MAASSSNVQGKKKFATCNLNQVLGAPKAAGPKTCGPAVRSAAVIKPVAKPKGLISLGKAPPGSNLHTRKGAAWSHLEEKAKERREEDAKKDGLAKPEWAILDFEDLDKPLSKQDEVPGDHEDAAGTEEEHVEAPTMTDDAPSSMEHECLAVPSAAHASHSSARPADTTEAASQTTDGDGLALLQVERQSSKLHRSYPSIEHAPSTGVSEAAVVTASEPGTSSSTGPRTHCVAVDATDGASRRSQTRSWADQYGSDNDETEPAPIWGSPTSGGMVPSAALASQAASKPQGADALVQIPGTAPLMVPSVCTAPALAGPPPPRGPPPAGPPPPARSEARAQQPRPMGPPPPMPPPAGPPMVLERRAPPGPPAPPVAEAERVVVPAVETPPSPKRAPVASQPSVRSPKAVPQDDLSPKLQPHENPYMCGPHAMQEDVRLVSPSSKQPHTPQTPEHEDAQHNSRHSRQPEQHRSESTLKQQRPPRREGSTKENVGAPPPAKAQGPWSPPSRQAVPTVAVEPPRPSALTGPASSSTANRGHCWGPAVAYTPAFAPRAPPERPMSEDFVNSGWKEKKLWTPPEPERPVRTSQASGAIGTGGPRSHLRGEASAAVGQGISKTLESGEGGETGKGSKPGARRPAKGPEGSGAAAAEAVLPAAAPAAGAAEPAARPPKTPKRPKSSREPPEVLDPESSSDDEKKKEEETPTSAQCQVFHVEVPRTAMVVNATHVLTRLNGCCSVIQLTKSVKSFKDMGVTVEAFLRSHPDSFKLEGRIVHLLNKDGEKWKPLEEVGGKVEFGKGRGKGKIEVRKQQGGSGEGSSSWSANSWSDWQAGDSFTSGKGRGKGKAEARKQHGGGGGNGGGGSNSWSASGWSDWQQSGYEQKWGWEDTEAGGWKSHGRSWHW